MILFGCGRVSVPEFAEFAEFGVGIGLYCTKKNVKATRIRSMANFTRGSPS
jgi:hypothetical protein